jgi:RNA polymerase sigma-70 factor, ECF subfamily
MIGSDLIQAGYRYALSLSHNEHNAEDLVQDACLKLIRAKGAVDRKSLLFVVIRNLFIDRYRHNAIVTFEELDAEGEYAQAEPEEPFDGDCSLEDLEKALATLRPEEREAIYLSYYESYSAAMIGEITKKPRNTVLSLLSRGKKKLAAALRSPQTAETNIKNRTDPKE